MEQTHVPAVALYPPAPNDCVVLSGILLAAHKGDMHSVKDYLSCQCDACKVNHPVNLTCDLNYGPLLIASGAGHADIVQLLLQHDADVEVSEAKSGMTCVMAAAQGLHENVLRLVLAAGALVYRKAAQSERGAGRRRNGRGVTT